MKKINEFARNIMLSLRILFKEDFCNTFLILLCSISIPIFSIVISYIMKWSIDYLTSENIRSLNVIGIYLIIYFFVKILTVTMSNIENYSGDVLNNRIRCYMNNVIIKKCFELDISLYDDANVYNEMQYVNSHYDSIYKMFTGIIEIVSAIVSCIIILITAFDKMLLFSMIIIFSCVPAGIAKLRYTKSFYDLSINQIRDERKLDYIIRLVLNKAYSQELRLYSGEKRIFKMHQSIWSGLVSQRNKLLKKSLIISTILLFLPEASYLVMMFIIVNRIITGSCTIGDFSLYLSLVTQIWGNVNRVMFDIDSINDDNRILSVLRRFLSKEATMKNGNKKIKEIKKIEFVDVYFRYPKTNDYILKNMNFIINKGDIIAIVGENGAGKTTIIKLMLRFYDVTEGKILINGLDIKKYDINDLRKCLGIYFQNSMNYAFQVKDNVTLDEEKDDKAMLKATKISEFNTIMNNKNITFDEYVTKLFDENGVELSGGEHQRLALTRSIYHEKNWLIFDEPSSALDPKSEYEFFRKIREVALGKTVIYISHRLANITFSDFVLVISDGEIIESGDIEYLMKIKGKFFELYNYQKNLYE